MTHHLVGKRVQLPAWSGTWMKGDRYGVITHVSEARHRVYVKTDKAHAVRFYPLDDVDEYLTFV